MARRARTATGPRSISRCRRWAARCRSPARRAGGPCAWACRWATWRAACSARCPSRARCCAALAPGAAHVDLSLLDCQVSLLSYLAQYFWTDGVVPRPMGSEHTSVVPYGTLATRDGHLIVAVFERFWPNFCRAAGHPEWTSDPRFAANGDRVANRASLMSLLERAFAARTTDDWLERLHAEGVPAAPIQTVDRVLSDPQVRHRGMVVEVEHERLGRVPTLGTPIKVDDVAGVAPAPPPRLGQHTDEVLGTLLKYP